VSTEIANLKLMFPNGVYTPILLGEGKHPSNPSPNGNDLRQCNNKLHVTPTEDARIECLRFEASSMLQTITISTEASFLHNVAVTPHQT
jgi:hypothetical protein